MSKTQILNDLKNHLKIKYDIEFAEYLGINQSTLANWKKRNTLDYDLVISKCDFVDANWLLTGEGKMLKEPELKKIVPEEEFVFVEKDFESPSIEGKNKSPAEVLSYMYAKLNIQEKDILSLKKDIEVQNKMIKEIHDILLKMSNKIVVN